MFRSFTIRWRHLYRSDNGEFIAFLRRPCRFMRRHRFDRLICPLCEPVEKCTDVGMTYIYEPVDKRTHVGMTYISGERWWKLRTMTVMMTDIVHMIMTQAKYTPAQCTHTINIISTSAHLYSARVHVCTAHARNRRAHQVNTGTVYKQSIRRSVAFTHRQLKANKLNY